MDQRYRIPRLMFMVLISIWCFSCPPVTFSQTETVEFPSSPNPVGSGARAMGMGGAFIAVADDATAASWNPAGLHQLETPEVSVVVNYFNRNDDNTFGTNPESSGPQDVSKESLNYLSAVYPFSCLDRSMVLSLNFQNLYDFSREYNFSFNQSDPAGTQVIKYHQTGSLSAFGIAYCVQATPKLSFGITLNIWDDNLSNNGWDQKTKRTFDGNDNGIPFSYQYDTLYEYSFNGINSNIGLMWRLYPNLTIGAVLKTPFTADLSIDATSSYSLNHPDFPNASPEETESSTNSKLDMPISYGFGLSYRFSDNLTVSFDIYRTEWDKFIFTDENGVETSPVTGKPIDESDISPTTQVRIGTEYIFITNNYLIPVRTGVFYDPAPAEENPDAIYGISIGSGIAKGRLVIDLAYQYRFGNDVGGSALQSLDFSQDIKEHTIYSSIIYYF